MQNWNSENGTKRKPGRNREDVDVLVSLLQLEAGPCISPPLELQTQAVVPGVL